MTEIFPDFVRNELTMKKWKKVEYPEWSGRGGEGVGGRLV